MAVRDLKAPDLSSEFLNKFMLPKIALTVIGVASLLGVVVTSWAEGIDNPFAIGARWLNLAVLGALFGASVWYGYILPWADRLRPSPAAQPFLTAESQRFDRLHSLLGRVGLLGLAAYLLVMAPGMIFPMRALVFAAIALSGGLALWLPVRDARGARRTALLSGVTLALIALSEVQAEGMATHLGLPLWTLVRIVHLLAFAGWFGGAIWNVFINAPSGRETLCLDTVIASHLQLEGFRKVVRVAFPAIVLTGLLQAGFISNLNLGMLVDTAPGHLILLKLGLAAVLLVIFFTCPMWGACSPIAGVCNLEDLSRAPAAGSPAPLRLLDEPPTQSPSDRS